MTTIPGNPYTAYLVRLANDGVHVPAPAVPVLQVNATLALAYEQHQRNRLAAITATHRGIDLPTDLAALANEGA